MSRSCWTALRSCSAQISMRQRCHVGSLLQSRTTNDCGRYGVRNRSALPYRAANPKWSRRKCGQHAERSSQGQWLPLCTLVDATVFGVASTRSSAAPRRCVGTSSGGLQTCKPHVLRIKRISSTQGRSWGRGGRFRTRSGYQTLLSPASMIGMPGNSWVTAWMGANKRCLNATRSGSGLPTCGA